MWIQVRTMDGRKTVQIDDLSKITKIEELRERLAEHFDAGPVRQRLFYRGKQLEDGHTLFDYDVGLNDLIQLMIRPVPQSPPPPTNGHDDNNSSSNGSNRACDSNNSSSNGACDSNNSINGDSENGTGTKTDQNGTGMETDQNGTGMDDIEEEEDEGAPLGLYKVKEKVDARDTRMGAWFEAEVVKVTSDPPPGAAGGDPIIHYHVKFDDYSDEEVAELTAANVRPRARYRLQWEQLVVGKCVMVNYNLDLPKERGFWYDAIITRKSDRKMELYGKLVLGEATDASEEVKVKFVDEIFRIETRTTASAAGSEDATNGEGVAVAQRVNKPDCDRCKDNPRRKCKFCACCVCGGKDCPDKQILCDECDMAYHLWCVEPKLEAVPEDDDWYCPSCRRDTSEVIGAGEKMRLTKKKANMMSKKGSCNRDWGKGMACVGRTKMCTIVPSNHWGPIPGVPVGSMWKFRVQVSESGVHRPHVAGIHGRESEGAYSIVLSGGYVDDVDDGNEFTYSGSGGRDLSGNKRTAKQSMDQKLTAMNKALARNCDAAVDSKNGGSAASWTNGKPVRVVRNHKGSKTSKYAPKDGNRYDGIYKVVKYWPEKGKNGFIVWKYLFKRDDPTPAPWTKEGKVLVKKLGLTMQYPEGYLEAQAAKEARAEEEEGEEEGEGREESSGDDKKATKRGKKRKSSILEPVNGSSPAAKKPRYELTKQQKTLIKADKLNAKVWEQLVNSISKGTEGLLSRIQEALTCIVCQEVVHQPITTTCFHNICKSCLTRSFKAEVYTCPSCRHELGKDYSLTINKPLQKVLLDIFPGYNGGR